MTCLRDRSLPRLCGVRGLRPRAAGKSASGGDARPSGFNIFVSGLLFNTVLSFNIINMTVKIILAVYLLMGDFIVENSERKNLSQDNTQFIYVLRYTDEFKKAIKWRAKENEIAREHVSYLKTLMDEEKGYMAGRTTNIYDPDLFGVVIFDAPNIEKAKEIMENDPLIRNNIMLGTLNPFNIVFIKEKRVNQ